jgi:hypothetical protein
MNRVHCAAMGTGTVVEVGEWPLVDDSNINGDTGMMLQFVGSNGSGSL